MHENGPPLVRSVLLDLGWKEYDEEIDENDWNLWWKSSRFTTSEIQRGGKNRGEKKLNHIPNSSTMTKKDCMVRTLRKMKGIYGNIFNFVPETFILPGEYIKFMQVYSSETESNNCKDKIWICKPSDMSRGRKIFLFQDISDLNYDNQYVVQRYVHNPLLIAGYKFDLRIYVLVTSFHPLKVYLYKEGLARFGTEKYDTSELGNKFAHLTNASINKLSPQYDVAKEGIGPGSKWTLKQLQKYFGAIDVSYDVVWKRIENLLNLTLIAFAETIPKNVGCCFELYGFDVILDDKLKPWLLEVNYSPALGADSIVDEIVKRPLVADMIDALQFKSTSSNYSTRKSLEGTMCKNNVIMNTLKIPTHRPKSASIPGCNTARPVRDNISALATYRQRLPPPQSPTLKSRTKPKTELTQRLLVPLPKQNSHEKEPSEAGNDEFGAGRALTQEFGDFYLLFPPNTALRGVTTDASNEKKSYDVAIREVVSYIKKRESSLLKKKN